MKDMQLEGEGDKAFHRKRPDAWMAGWDKRCLLILFMSLNCGGAQGASTPESSWLVENPMRRLLNICLRLLHAFYFSAVLSPANDYIALCFFLYKDFFSEMPSALVY